jgi:hypothetical protein
VGYTDGRLSWCLRCAEPDDMAEYGLVPVYYDQGDRCEECGMPLEKGE